MCNNCFGNETSSHKKPGHAFGHKVYGNFKTNLFLFFQTWMCGGRILIHPCSHIGHVSRIRNTYSRDSVFKNVARAAEVWLHGKYKKMFRLSLPWSHRNVSYYWLCVNSDAYETQALGSANFSPSQATSRHS